MGTGAAAGVAGCLDLGYRSAASGTPAEQADAQFRGGLRRQGYRDTSLPQAMTVAWTLGDVNTGAHTAAKASAIETSAGTIIIPGDSGYLWSVTPDGDVRWRTRVTRATRGIHGTPAVANGLVYIGAYDGALSAFDVETGDRAWRVDLGDAIGSSPSYHNGRIYIAVEYAEPSGSIFALDAATGGTQWVDDRPTNHPHSTIAIDLETGHLVVGANDGDLYAWRYPDLSFAWTYSTGRPIKGPIATDGQAAYFGSWDNQVHRVDLATGESDWTYKTGSDVMSGPSLVDGLVYVGSHDGNLYALEAATGGREWSFDTGAQLIGCPTVTRDHVLIGSYDATLHCVTRAGDGAWQIETQGRVTSTPLVTEDAVYFAERAPNGGENGESGRFYALNSA